VRTVLVDRLHAAAFVVGETSGFGHRAAGDVPLLAKLGEKYYYITEGVPLLVVETVVTTLSTTSASADRRVGQAGRGGARRRTGWKAWSSRAHAPAGRSGFPTPTWSARRTPRSPRTASSGWLLSLTADGEEDGAWPAAISVGPNATFGEAERPSRPTPWTATT